MNDLPVITLEELSTRLENLEQRVSQLENPSTVFAAPIEIRGHTALDGPISVTSPASQAGGIFPLLGKAMLGIAGAYLLRAISESTALPKAAVAAIAIAYAFAWLVSAVRATESARITGIVYAATSALILVPMLWELTLRFRVLQPEFAASILAAFVLATVALSWNRRSTGVFWIASLSGETAAVALSVATHRLMPFIAALLLIDVLCEYSAQRNRAQGVRPLIAAATDIAVWASIFIYAGPESSRPEYPPLSAAAILVPVIALFLISAGSIAIRAVLRRHDITSFETVQATVSLGLATWGAYCFAPHFGLVEAGASYLLLGAFCYAIVIARIRLSAAGRNEQIFMAWGALLLLIGSFFCLPQIGIALVLGLAAIAATLLGSRFNRLTLQIHGLVLLVSAALGSGLFAFSWYALAGPIGATPTPMTGALIATVSAVVCYLARDSRDAGKSRWLQLIPAAIGTLAVAAFLVQGLCFLASMQMALDGYHIALIRTLSCSIVLLAVAFAGGRFDRAEFVQIAYAALALIAVKLLFEDLRQGHFAFIAVSIFIYAIALIVVPRLVRSPSNARN